MQKKPTTVPQHGNHASWNKVLMLEKTNRTTTSGTKLNLKSILAQAGKFQSYWQDFWIHDLKLLQGQKFNKTCSGSKLCHLAQEICIERLQSLL